MKGRIWQREARGHMNLQPFAVILKNWGEDVKYGLNVNRFKDLSK